MTEPLQCMSEERLARIELATDVSAMDILELLHAVKAEKALVHRMREVMGTIQGFIDDWRAGHLVDSAACLDLIHITIRNLKP